MNLSIKPLVVTLLLVGATQAIAASSVDLAVKGLITPSSCTPTLSNGGAVDYGKISAKDLNADRKTFLPMQTLQLTVTCDAATLMAIEGKDNRAGSDYENDQMEYGLGLINGTEKLGGMTLGLRNPVADGVAARTIISYDSGNTWAPDYMFMDDTLLSVADASTVAPMPVQMFNADLQINPFIAPTNQLTLTNEAAIDGSVTLTVKYL
ncbi:MULTISPECIES: DUF1120 domain-containing protein [Pseudomonas]|uniref:DUF1120 domain-containing protein n=1 Tax=Pseudomonas TaxID=286 RepID=UPI00098FB23D|nr:MULTISPECIES: DUF1120 domain-containing protein [Pseudomonas]AQT92737.1 hypothetical protein B1R45_05510 [Pseudomonas azotoformans]MBT1259378.1 DUF1120 domain-containing protein [Pseudomonas sp. VS40]MBT1270986.1 DUF1120 domain-containing protein [Pseudomonas sp. VS59]PJK34611.1 DUF1120 domain-containing protein [Pseudomonas sp. S09F 262]PJK38553.1 DUF1120 domain-containing protein [Pseudomonas sp. S10E 269]